MSHFICPVCGGQLYTENKSLVCDNHHCYDKAKSGYTNLLLSQQSKAKRHGDDKLMVRSRQAFLNKGYYHPLLDMICETLLKYIKDKSQILDAGCGECWYTANIYSFLTKNNIRFDLFGIDISKDALALGAKRNPQIELAVASVFKLPVRDSSCDMVFSFFSPFCSEEFLRILKKGGIVLKVFPLEKHLFNLKSAVYDNPYENEVIEEFYDGFTQIEKHELRSMIHLSNNEDILNVFSMTPYYYKTSENDQKKLLDITELDTQIEFGLSVYRKN